MGTPGQGMMLTTALVCFVLSLSATPVGAAPLQEAAIELKIGCSEQPLSVEYTDIKYYSGKVDCGNLLLESDIGGTHPWIPPKVRYCWGESCIFPTADDGLYTLIYLDPYVDIPSNGSWPSCGDNCKGSKAPARHWVVGNINADMLRSGNLSNATTVSAFKGPSPPWGSHPYGQFLFRQKGEKKVDFETLPSPLGIYNWDYATFIEKYELGTP